MHFPRTELYVPLARMGQLLLSGLKKPWRTLQSFRMKRAQEKAYRATPFTGVRCDCMTRRYCILHPDPRPTIIGSGDNCRVFYNCYGHTVYRFNPGDQVIMPFKGGPMVCQFIEVEYRIDPYDLYFGVIEVLDYLDDIKSTQDQTGVINR